jgi:protein CpxP
MKTMYCRTLSIVVIALLLSTSALFAEGHYGHHGGFGHMLGFYADALDLTSTQQDQIKAVWQKEKPSLKPLMQQMRQNHAAMNELAESGTFDEAKATALATQNAQTMIQLQVAHARVKNEMIQVLTPDQKAKLQTIESKHQARSQKNAPPTTD